MHQDRIILERLAWLEDAFKLLRWAAGTELFPASVRVTKTVDPLKMLITIPLGSAVPKDGREPLRNILRCYAAMSDCELPRINIDKRAVHFEAFIKQRHEKNYRRSHDPRAR